MGPEKTIPAGSWAIKKDANVPPKNHLQASCHGETWLNLCPPTSPPDPLAPGLKNAKTFFSFSFQFSFQFFQAAQKWRMTITSYQFKKAHDRMQELEDEEELLNWWNDQVPNGGNVELCRKNTSGLHRPIGTDWAKI